MTERNEQSPEEEAPGTDDQTVRMPIVEETVSMRLEQLYGPKANPQVNLPEDAGGDAKAVEGLAAKPRTDSRYVFKGEIGRGGMGVVLRVFDAELRRTLAMKVVLGSGGASTGDTPAVDPEQLSRFLEEAQVTGQLDHPGVVPVHELGVDQDGQVYFTMRLVKGRTFREVIDLVHQEGEGRGESWAITRALGHLLKVCEAMAFAHDKGVVHRDLKPANVMVGEYGEVYVMDWGIARVHGREDTHSRVTSTALWFAL